ncbi:MULTISPECIES: hypothetical protein [unclassified Streptomyces]|uniref:hypothetical protein n=1 Tax=unclassified Streptomyces TaxID=2593676 RepID=UPI00278BE47A|nr:MULTISPECIES: hypothetical protein [unclassified Streptomyces]
MPWVNPYERADGTKVRGYSRWAAGARREMAIFVGVAVVVVAGGSNMGGASSASQSGSGAGQQPRPKTTAVYPVHFPGWEEPKKPEPTVSYPIRFSSPGGGR